MTNKVAMYWHNGRSLGHTAESAKIATALRKSNPALTIVGVTGAHKGLDMLPSDMGIVHLPAFTNYDRLSGWGTENNYGLSTARLFEARTAISSAFTAIYKPDVFIVNHLPQGAENELRPGLVTESCHNVLTLRGFLFDRDKTYREYFSKDPAAWISDHYETITVHMPETIFQLEEHYDVPKHLVERIRYTGYLTRQDNRDIEPLRGCLGWAADERVLVVSMGGGQGAGQIIGDICDRLIHLRERFDRVVIAAGPYLEADSFNSISDIVERDPKFELHRYVSNMADLMRACDLFIGAAGGNMIAEILAAGCSSILIPRQVRESEQQMHSRLVARAGWAAVCLPGDIASKSFDEEVIHGLSREPLALDVELFNGADKYAGIIGVEEVLYPDTPVMS